MSFIRTIKIHMYNMTGAPSQTSANNNIQTDNQDDCFCTLTSTSNMQSLAFTCNVRFVQANKSAYCLSKKTTPLFFHSYASQQTDQYLHISQPHSQFSQNRTHQPNDDHTIKMSNVYSPESPELKSSPALPHLLTCIEAVICDAVQSGREEEPMRQFLRLHARHFEGILNTLHAAYHLTSTEQTAETSSIESSKDQQPSLLPAAEIRTKQPSRFKDRFDWNKVEDDDDDDDDDLAPDETRTVVGGGEETHVLAPRPRPYETLPHRGKKAILTATDRLQQAIERSKPYPKTPACTPHASAAQTPVSDDGSDTPRQMLFNPSSSSPLPLRQESAALGSSALAGDVDQTSEAAAAADLEQAKLASRIEKARGWVDGQPSASGSPMADPNWPPYFDFRSDNEKEALGNEFLAGMQMWLDKVRSDEEKKLAFQAQDREQTEMAGQQQEQQTSPSPDDPNLVQAQSSGNASEGFILSTDPQLEAETLRLASEAQRTFMEKLQEQTEEKAKQQQQQQASPPPPSSSSAPADPKSAQDQSNDRPSGDELSTDPHAETEEQ